MPRMPLLLCSLIAAPAVVLRISGAVPAAPVAVFSYGAAVVAAAFILAWAAEAARKDISGALAVALLALVAVLPEYAVDLYYAYGSGSNPELTQFASANMNGSNRLLLGFGWPLVVLVALYAQRSRVLVLPRSTRRDVAVLGLLTILAVVIPVSGRISVLFGLVLILIFLIHLVVASREESGEEPEFVSVSADLVALPQRTRRITVTLMFLLAAAVILAAAEPFASNLVEAGSSLGVDSYLLVQWLAPLASEAPEFIVAVLFAVRGQGAMAIGTLIASKINQWSLLVGSLPLAHWAGGGTAALPLDARQVEEFTLTVSQTLLGIAVIVGLRFHRWSAIALAGLFFLQFFITGTEGRYLLSVVHVIGAAILFWINRKHVLPTCRALLHRDEPADEAIAAVDSATVLEYHDLSTERQPR